MWPRRWSRWGSRIDSAIDRTSSRAVSSSASGSRGRSSSRPKVLLADEPTGNLDSASADEVLGLLELLNRQGTTVVLVTHSEEVAHRAARIVRVADGLIVSDGPVERHLEIELAG